MGRDKVLTNLSSRNLATPAARYVSQVEETLCNVAKQTASVWLFNLQETKYHNKFLSYFAVIPEVLHEPLIFYLKTKF